MGYDGTLRFNTEIDRSGFEKGLSILKKSGLAAGAAIGAGLGYAAKTGAEFEAQMSTVQAISGATSDELLKLTDKAVEMGAKSVFSASESGKAFEYMAMAGWKTSDMLGGIEGIMNLAAASGESLATVSDIVTDALTAFGLSASDAGMFADVLAAASSNSNTNVGMMGETFKYAAPLAGALGYSIQDVAIATGLMANSGIKAGQAGTSLRSILTRMAKPTKQSAQAMKKLGVSLTDSNGKIKPFRQQLTELRNAFSKLTPAQKTENAALLAGQEGMSGLLAIVNAAPADFEKLTNSVDNAAGSAQNMADTRLDNLAGDLEELSGAGESLALTFYDGIKEPAREAVQSATEKVDELTQSLASGELSGALQNVGTLFGSTIGGAVDLATTAIPLLTNGINAVVNNAEPLIGVIGGATAVIGGYKAAVGTVSTLTSLWGAATAALTNPVGMVGAAVGLTAVAVYGITNAVKQAETEFYNMGDALDEAAVKYTEAKDKATLTDDYAAKWRDLNKAISDGSLSGEDLTAAEKERKGIEEWFISNYGNYISAEEQKNGIREETIGLIREEAALLSEIARLELTNKIMDMQPNVKSISENVTALKEQNTQIEASQKKMLEQNIALQKATKSWNSLTFEQQMSGQYQDIYNRMIDEASAALGRECKSYNDIISVIAENNTEIEKGTGLIADNNVKIADGTESLQSYADNCRAVIESGLGGSLEETAAKYDLVKSAMDKLNSGTALTEDEITALRDKFPELAEQDVNIETLQSVFDTLKDKIDTAKQTAYDFGVELNGLPKDIDININLKVPDVPHFAHGTKGAKAGLAVVNDGNGPELIQSRDGSFRMVQSNGAALTYLNSGDRVYTAEQTKALMRSVPHYAGGIGNEGYVGTVSISFVEKVPEAFDRALDELELRRDLDVIDEAEYYEELAKLRDEYFEKGSDKWWEYEKEIYDYRKETAKAAADAEFNELDRLLNLEKISESEYYEQLGSLRDKYYAEGSKEHTDYTDKIYKYQQKKAIDARDEEFDNLKKYLDYGYMSEKEYYAALASLRDKHFAEGSDGWQQYTDEIVSYYRSKVTAMSSALKSELNTAARLFNDNSLIIEGADRGRVLTKDGWLDKNGQDLTLGGLELADLSGSIEELHEYDEMLTSLTERGVDEGLMSYIAGLSMKEAKQIGDILLNSSEEQFKKFNEQYAKYNALADILAERQQGYKADGGLLSGATDEIKKNAEIEAETIGESFTNELVLYFDTVPEKFYDFGKASADRFGDGFHDTIENVLNSIASDLISDIEAAAAKFEAAAGGKNSGTVNNYNTSYTVGSSKQSITEQLAEIERREEFERLRKG